MTGGALMVYADVRIVGAHDIRQPTKEEIMSSKKKSKKNYRKASSVARSRIQDYVGYFTTRRTQKDGSQR